MFKKIFESCEDSIVKRVSNPYFGTYIAVLLIDNWELIYTLFTFSSYETRDTRISIIADYRRRIVMAVCKMCINCIYPIYNLLYITECFRVPFKLV